MAIIKKTQETHVRFGECIVTAQRKSVDVWQETQNQSS